MSSPVRSFALVFALGVAALLFIGLVERRSEAFTLGVVPAIPTYVGAGHTLCQSPVDVAEDFTALRLTVAAPVVSSDPARVDVVALPRGRRLASGVLHGGYPSRMTTATVRLPRVRSGERVRVCVRTSRRGGLLVFGNASAAVRGSSASLDGRRRKGDIDLVFLREHRTSVIETLGEIARRASLFHGGWAGPWTIWALALLMLTAFPVLLGLALARAGERPDGQPSASASE